MLTAHGRMGGVIDWILNYKHIHHRRALSRPIYLQTRHRQDQINSPIQPPFQSGFSSPLHPRRFIPGQCFPLAMGRAGLGTNQQQYNYSHASLNDNSVLYCLFVFPEELPIKQKYRQRTRESFQIKLHFQVENIPFHTNQFLIIPEHDPKENLWTVLNRNDEWTWCEKKATMECATDSNSIRTKCKRFQ